MKNCIYLYSFLEMENNIDFKLVPLARIKVKRESLFFYFLFQSVELKIIFRNKFFIKLISKEYINILKS